MQYNHEHIKTIIALRCCSTWFFVAKKRQFMLRINQLLKENCYNR